MNKNSPFQDWLDNNTQGYAFSLEIRVWMAKAFEGGRVHGIEQAARLVAERYDINEPWIEPDDVRNLK